jgi:predicted AAA+ superfamily ATPase
LLCYLLGLEKKEQVSRDPLVGNLFENLVVLEALKARYNRGLSPNLYFSRDSQGHEIDLLWSSGRELTGVEIKSASTWTSGFKKELLRYSKKVAPLANSWVIYNGDPMQFSDGVRAIHYTETDSLFDFAG